MADFSGGGVVDVAHNDMANSRGCILSGPLSGSQTTATYDRAIFGSPHASSFLGCGSDIGDLDGAYGPREGSGAAYVYYNHRL